MEALKQTGYYDKFNVLYNEDGKKNSFTILAESDVVYAQEGINSFQGLADRFSPGDTDYTNPENELNRFIAYHATKNFLYAINFPDEGFIGTVLEKNAWSVYKTDKNLKINESETGENDTWTSLVIAGSNNPAKNGVYHTVDKLLTVFTPKAKYLIWDLVTSQPEYQQGLVTNGQKVPSTTYEHVRWFPEDNKRFFKRSNAKNYKNSYFDVGSYQWIEFDTPILPKGKYEMLICSNGGNSSRAKLQVYWDGEPIGSIYDITARGDQMGWDDPVGLEAQGWRRGYKCITDNTGANQYDSRGNMRFIITKELLLSEQKSHVIRLQAVKSGASPLDFIEFIPVYDGMPADVSECPPSGDGK